MLGSIFVGKNLSKTDLKASNVQRFGASVSCYFLGYATNIFNNLEEPQANMSWVTVGDMSKEPEDFPRPAVDEAIDCNTIRLQLVMTIRGPYMIWTIGKILLSNKSPTPSFFNS